VRKLHRWLGAGAAVFLLSVAITGTLLQFQQFFGEDEADKEKLAQARSDFTLASSLDAFAPEMARAQATVQAKAGKASLDKVELQLKGDHPVFILHTSGVEQRKFVVNAETGVIEKEDMDERESFLLRLHTGEVFGDGGVVMGMLWGTALVVLTASGIVMYWQMGRRRNAPGWKKWFW
jgi:hypothetical protein